MIKRKTRYDQPENTVLETLRLRDSDETTIVFDVTPLKPGRKAELKREIIFQV
jgi:hypothetical protein